MLQDPATHASLSNEYCTGYDTKLDAKHINTRLVTSSCLLQEQTKTKEQVARSVLARALNRVQGSITKGPMMLLAELLGYGDFLISHKFKTFDFRPFSDAVINPLASSSASSADGNRNNPVKHRVVVDAGGHRRLANEVDAWFNRSEVLSSLSPSEGSSMFNFEKAETQATLLFMLKADHPLSATHGHRPQATFTIPKFISSPPVCPEGTDDLDACDAWARFALGNFFSERCMDKLVGVTLWDKWVYWRDEVTIQKQAVRTDLGNLDFVALEVLSRIQLATKSRRLMSSLAGDRMKQQQALRIYLPNTASSAMLKHDDDRGFFESADDMYDEEEAMALNEDLLSHFEPEAIQQLPSHLQKLMDCLPPLPLESHTAMPTTAFSHATSEQDLKLSKAVLKRYAESKIVVSG